jgi:transglutaminase-like putative cysteine protease
LRRSLWTWKFIRVLLAGAMLWHPGGLRIFALTPSAALPNPSTREVHAPSETVSNQFDSLLKELRIVVKQGLEQAEASPQSGFADIQELRVLSARLIACHQRNLAQLTRALAQKSIDDAVKNRQQAFVNDYEQKYQTLLAHLQAIESAETEVLAEHKHVEWKAILNPLMDFLIQNTERLPQRTFDPRNLPRRSLKSEKSIQPKLTRADWDKSLWTKSGIRLNATSQPAAADLSETVEVQFTPEIRQLAQSLDHNPVKIFNWVHNNIEFIPTWGSIQGAQLCLETRNGNAFDTASLLVALLRVSGVPARYQPGTIEVPAEKFKNWAGGFSSAEAAASFFASGGVPSVVRRLNQSGQLVSIKLEHVWVKAFVDYSPSGAALNRRASSWVEIDPSFKQYQLQQGVDFETVTPSNTTGVLNQLVSQATIDQATGSVTNFNSQALQTHTESTLRERGNFGRVNLLNSRANEIFGGKDEAALELEVLPAALAFHVLARGTEIAEIPDSLRHRITIALGSNSQAPEIADQYSYATSLPALAGRSMLLTYVPATAGDRELLIASEGSYPSAINLIPQLYVGSQRVAQGSAVGIGRALPSTVSFSAPTISLAPFTNNLLAGESAGLGLDLQGVSTVQMDALRQKADLIRTQLQQNPLSVLSSDLGEAFLVSNVMNWFAAIDLNNRLTAQKGGVVTVRFPSAGLFAIKLNAASLFGTPASVTFAGLSMDIDRDVVVSEAKDGDRVKTTRVNFTQGTFGSAMEAELPSRALTIPGQTVPAIATAQALRMANDQGIPVYTINQSNAQTILPLLQIDAADLADISDALNAGMEVTVSRSPVRFHGQNVLGLVISDPQTKTANFLISGGTNGAIMLFFFSIMFVIVMIGAIFSLGLMPVILAGLVGIIVLIASAFRGIAFNERPDPAAFYVGIVGVFLAAIGTIALGTLGAVVAAPVVILVAAVLLAFLVSLFFIGELLSRSTQTPRPHLFTTARLMS